MAMGPSERQLFESTAASLYEHVVVSAGIPADDPRIAAGADLHEAFELLHELGLVTPGDDARWMPVDPTAVQAQVVTPLGQQGAELISESAQWSKIFGSLTHMWRRSPQPGGGPLTEIRGVEAIEGFLASLVRDAEEELLTAQPQAGRNIKGLADVVERESAALSRGVRIRTLYQHAARRNPDTRQYVAEAVAAGAEVRTLDEFFNRIIVVDRRVALIPKRDDLRVAMVIRESSLVAYLVDMFERHWERARPFTSSETAVVREVAAEQRAMTIRMLLQGRADSAGAKRLGVSPRTYAAYVADLKTEFDAETRFQLGYAMGKRGISGRETDPGGTE